MQPDENTSDVYHAKEAGRKLFRFYDECMNARSLHLTTTAEGIEDDAVRRQLTDLGCEQAQGYLFARPMPAAQFEAQQFGSG